MKKGDKKYFKAWAIDLNTEKFDGFIGRYYFNTTNKIPDQVEGCQWCLFKTRSIARSYLKEMKSGSYVSFPKARVVKVKVTMEIL